MVNITNKLIDKKVNNIRFFLNYPEIELQNESEEVGRFASFVNEFIKNDVSIFEEVVISTLKEEFIIGNINVISEQTYISIKYYIHNKYLQWSLYE